MVLGDLEKWLGPKGGALVNGIIALIKETLKSPLAPSTMWGHSEKAPSMNQEEAVTRHGICQHLNLGLPGPQSCEKKIFVVYKPSSWQYCAVAAQINKHRRLLISQSLLLPYFPKMVPKYKESQNDLTVGRGLSLCSLADLLETWRWIVWSLFLVHQGPVAFPGLTQLHLSANECCWHDTSHCLSVPDPWGPLHRLWNRLTCLVPSAFSSAVRWRRLHPPSLCLSTPYCHFYSAPRFPNGKPSISALCLGFLFKPSGLLLLFPI
jgi:hypothetical protein